MTPTRWALLALLVAVVAVFPVVDKDQYTQTVFVSTMILVVLNISWNFILGIAGVWNFGQLAVYALGGYGAGILILHAGVPTALAILLGGLVAAAVSVVMAIPTLRLFGIYTSLLTFAFAEIVQYSIMNDSSGLTGGSFGFPMVHGLFSRLSPAAALRANYWLMLAVVLLSMLAVALVKQSSLGIALRAIRDAPALTAARGVSPLRYRIIAFALSGFLAGIAGGLYVSFEQSISPSAMGLTPMSLDVTMLVIGGMGTVFGPALGTVVVTIVQTLLVSDPGVELTVVGAFLLTVVVFVPGGVVGLSSRLRVRLAAWAVEPDEAGRTGSEGQQDASGELLAADTGGGRSDVAE
ncbi:MAG: branched-chain amino acid ABC transporter permease [Acidimicrobiales bacterium]